MSEAQAVRGGGRAAAEYCAPPGMARRDCSRLSAAPRFYSFHEVKSTQTSALRRVSDQLGSTSRASRLRRPQPQGPMPRFTVATGHTDLPPCAPRRTRTTLYRAHTTTGLLVLYIPQLYSRNAPTHTHCETVSQLSSLRVTPVRYSQSHIYHVYSHLDHCCQTSQYCCRSTAARRGRFLAFAFCAAPPSVLPSLALPE